MRVTGGDLGWLCGCVICVHRVGDGERLQAGDDEVSTVGREGERRECAVCPRPVGAHGARQCGLLSVTMVTFDHFRPDMFQS